MLIISIAIMKTIDERKRCDTRCVLMRRSNSVIISVIKTVRDAGNVSGIMKIIDRREMQKKKGNKKKNKDRKEQGVTDAIVKA